MWFHSYKSISLMSTDHRSLATEDSRPQQNNLVMDAVREEEATHLAHQSLDFFRKLKLKRGKFSKN